MTRRLAVLFAVPGLLSLAPQTVFRARADLVAIDASVMDGKKPVTTLTRHDFVVRDNGVEQTLLDVGREQFPLDITLTIDVSGSVTPPQRRTIEHAIGQVGAALLPADRCSVVTFTNHIAQESPMQPPPLDVPLPQRPSGGTSILDVLLLSFVTAPAPDRRQLNLMLTDGADTTSFFDEAILVDTMKYAAGQTTVVLVGGGAEADPRSLRIFAAVTATSGGQIIKLGKGDALNKAFLAALDAFRTSYVLHYTTAQVPRPGWHAVEVTTKNPKYQVRARQGYWVRIEG